MLIDTLNSDPWGLSYRIVLNRIRKSSPSFVEQTFENDLRKVLAALFPDNTRKFPPIPDVPEWNNEWDVSAREIAEFVKKRAAKKMLHPTQTISRPQYGRGFRRVCSI